jgi:hypothetical protein
VNGLCLAWISDQISSVFVILCTPAFAAGGERADQITADHARSLREGIAR